MSTSFFRHCFTLRSILLVCSEGGKQPCPFHTLSKNNVVCDFLIFSIYFGIVACLITTSSHTKCTMENIRANFIHINPTIYIYFRSLYSVFSTFCMRLMVSFKRYQSIFGSVGKCLCHFSSNPVFCLLKFQTL